MSEAPWELFYWCPVKDGKLAMLGRAEMIRLMFEVTGTPFIERGMEEGGRDKVIGMMRVNGGNTTQMPCFAPAIIRKGDFILNQTPAIMRYLGKHFGLFPTTWQDEAHADALQEFVVDFFAEGRLVFHGRCFTESYLTQQEETKHHIKWFEDTRLPAFLNHLETVFAFNLKQHPEGFAIGSTMTYVDISLFHVLTAAKFQFPEVYAQVSANAPQLERFREQIASVPKIAAYLASDRRGNFGGDSMM